MGVITIVAHPKTQQVTWAEWQATGRIGNIRTGQHLRYELYYRQDGLIDSVVYSRPGRGNEGKQMFRYHYEDGALRSVQADEASPSFHPRVVLLVPTRRAGGPDIYEFCR